MHSWIITPGRDSGVSRSSCDQTRAEELDRTNRRRGNGGLIFDFDHWSPGSIYEASRADWGEGLPRNALEEGSMAWEASEPLGAGAFGSVVKVRRDGQSYALKRILPHSRVSSSCEMGGVCDFSLW